MSSVCNSNKRRSSRHHVMFTGVRFSFKQGSIFYPEESDLESVSFFTC